MALDQLSLTRIKKKILEHRQKHATFPTLKELEQYGFEKKKIEQAVKEEVLEQLYVNLTSGATVKVYKVKSK